MSSAEVLERRSELIACLLSEGRRHGARLVGGEQRAFGLDRTRTIVHVPNPVLSRAWSERTLTCGIALQCSPTKDLVAQLRLDDLSPREQAALSVVDAESSLGWVQQRWPGLMVDFDRVLGAFTVREEYRSVDDLWGAAVALAQSSASIEVDPLFGRLPGVMPRRQSLAATLRRQYGRMPWTSKRSDRQRIHSIPVGGDGGVRDPNLPPPSRPEDDEIEVRADERFGVPYPEWDMWSGRFLPDHVSVLERPVTGTVQRRSTVSPGVRRWFEEHTQRSMRNGLEDGTDIDIDRYVDLVVDRASGVASGTRVFRDLAAVTRDVSTALLLDASASLGANSGTLFRLELECADALSQAMSLARERHGVFAFTGNTRHRVEVRCLKDFDQRHFVAPSSSGLVTGGYTRLGAPIRHLTTRLLAQRSQRRLLIIIGDGLMCDEGYEGRYAWADVAHAVEEAEEAGIAIYYIGVGATRVDPLPEVFGERRSQRIRRADDLPAVLARVHGELVAA